MADAPTHGGRRRGAGRKPSTGEKREHLVKVYLADAEYAELLDASGTDPIGPWIREVALARARGLKRPPPR